MSGDTKMSTRILVINLKKRIATAIRLPMLKRASAAQECVVDSVEVIESLNENIEALTERLEVLEEKYTALHKRVIEHIKTGV